LALLCGGVSGGGLLAAVVLHESRTSQGVADADGTGPGATAPLPTRPPAIESPVTVTARPGPIGTLPPVGTAIGNLAPDFSLPDLAGEPIALAEHRGQVVVLNFWSISCSPCLDELPELQDFYLAYRPQAVVVMAIHVGEGSERAQGVSDGRGVTFPVLLDRDWAVADSYQVRGLPTTLVLDRDGVIRQLLIGGRERDDFARAVDPWL
jgi:peroxiredoxin